MQELGIEECTRMSACITAMCHTDLLGPGHHSSLLQSVIASRMHLRCSLVFWLQAVLNGAQDGTANLLLSSCLQKQHTAIAARVQRPQACMHTSSNQADRSCKTLISGNLKASLLGNYSRPPCSGIEKTSRQVLTAWHPDLC